MLKIFEPFKKFVGFLAKLTKEHGRTTVINCVLLALLSICVISIVEFRMNGFVSEQISKYNENNTTEHRENFAKSREFYAELKTYLRQQRTNIGCDYILLLEFHNGSENIVTNIQFCKFDITLSVQDPNSPYIEVTDYVNENIYKYDLLLSDVYMDNRINILSIEELEKIDKHFLHLVTDYNSEVKHVVFATIEYNGSPIGMLVFLFTENEMSNIDMVKITNCIAKTQKEIQRGI